MARRTDRPHKLGWKRQLPDSRDRRLLLNPPASGGVPASVDLRPHFPAPPYDQGAIGSCTANALAAAVQFDRFHTGQAPDFIPSRLFIYYNERAIEGTVTTDAGANLRDGIKAIVNQGVCPESEWPYDDTPADPNTSQWPAGARPATAPSPEAVAAAAAYDLAQYLSINQDIYALKLCLANGLPFVFGISVYSSLWDDSGAPKADVPLPAPSDVLEGGHAICCVGYDDATQTFLIRNSWGPNVQDGGHFRLPYAYVTNPDLASDFWSIITMRD